MPNIEIIPAVMASTREELLKRILEFGAFAPSVHVDFMDGTFVRPISWPFKPDQELGHIETETLLEAHLMVENQSFGAELPPAGFSRILCHLEAFADITEARLAFKACHEEGAKEVGVSIRAETPLERLHDVADLCNVIQVMGIEGIGYQGQGFLPSTYARVAEIQMLYPKVIIAVDGGVSEETVWGLVHAGATRLVAGSAVSDRTDPVLAYQRLLEIARA